VSARLSDEDARWLKSSCAAAGVPERVTDPDAVARAAALLGDAYSPRDNRDDT